MATEVPRVNDVLECAGRRYVVVSRRWESGVKEMSLVLREERHFPPLHEQVRR